MSLHVANKSEVRYLEGGSLIVTRLENSDQVRIEIADELIILSAKIKRVFPGSDPQNYFSIQDGSNHEVGVLRTLDGLDESSKAILTQELDRRYFTPKIIDVTNLRQDGGMWLFSVTTQRGDAEFYVRNWRESSHEIQPGKWSIHSVDGRRFEIPNWDALPDRTKRLLEELF